jgi:hypothetical protein
VRDVLEIAMGGVADLIAGSPESQNAPHNLTPKQMAELIFAVSRGMMMRDVLETERGSMQRREQQLKVLRSLWGLLFSGKPEPTYA